MSLQKLSIAPRAAIGFGLVAMLVIVLGVFSLFEMEEMRRQSDKVNEDWLPSVITLGELQKDSQRLRAITLRLILNRNHTSIENDLSLVNEIRSTINNSKAYYEKLISSNEESNIYKSFKQAQELYLTEQEKTVNLIRQGDFEDATMLVQGSLSKHADLMSQGLIQLTEFNKLGAVKAAEKSGAVADSARAWVMGILALSVVVTSVLALLLTNSIVSPLKEAVHVAEVIATGDLTQIIDPKGSDEPARLLAALNSMQKSLRHTIQNIADTSSQLASASEELHAVTEDSTRSLHQQNTELEQAAAAVNEMTSTVEDVARNAVNTSEASSSANVSALKSREEVRQTVSSIGRLADDVNQTASDVEQLAVNIREISKVLDVIRSIAEQTNLLALNAAIEAARAGDAGRGFAVVADEVRALAHRTQQSTQEIENMIGSIQGDTNQAVSAMQNSNTLASTTLEKAQTAGRALDLITEAITSISENNLVISSATEEQAKVSREVDRILVNIRDISLQNSAGANQVNASSHELSRLAINLNSLVCQFKI